MKNRAIYLTLIAAISLVLFGCGDNSIKSDINESMDNIKNKEQEIDMSGIEPYIPQLPKENVESSIFVTPIEGISDDFIRGMDISSLLAEEESGVRYYDADGNEEDLLKILADAGVNYVRVRVWNDPFDEDGHGYGGGNCNVDTAIKIGRRAKKYGMKTCVDFHYSDFWADPSKQMSPKAWVGYDVDGKINALKEYTIDSLNKIIDAGVDVGMVQVGNETNSGMAGIKSHDNLYKLIKGGCEAVRTVAKERDKDIKVVVHFTQIDNYEDTLKKAEDLKKVEADYDVFGVSYYPYWHGSFENMEKVLTDINAQYGVDTCIMETAYPFTDEDSDCSSNSISGTTDILAEYPASVDGQAKALRDVMNSANKAKALGVFYWEGAWISVGNDLKANQEKWEKYGSGWASSYAGVYDPDDAGKYYGGCSWDNQALFDAKGHPLESLNVFKYVKYGASAPLKVLAIKPVKLEYPLGQRIELPSKVDAVFNDSDATEQVEVDWNSRGLDGIDVNQPGKYYIKGETKNGWPIEAEIKLISVNYLLNPSFEEADVNMWQVEYEGENDPTDIQNKASDAYSGDRAFHFWNAKQVDFKVFQVITDIPEGNYSADCYIQGGDMGASENVCFYVLINGEEYAHEEVKLTGWVDWKNPSITDIPVKPTDEITVGMKITGDGGGWGTIDDWEFY